MNFHKPRAIIQNDLISLLSTGLHDIKIDGERYHATLDMKYIPNLDSNKAAFRLNIKDKTQVSFFDCFQNVWVSVPYDGEIE